MCSHNLCFEQKFREKKNHLKIIKFTAFKNCCIWHRHVCIMSSIYLQTCLESPVAADLLIQLFSISVTNNKYITSKIIYLSFIVKLLLHFNEGGALA